MSTHSLAELLRSVPDSYEFFVDYVSDYADHFGVTDEIVSFIEGNAGATSSDVIIELHRLVHGE